MPGLQTVLSRINRAFGTDQIADVATDRDAYAPGKPLGPPQIAIPKDSALYQLWLEYVKQVPPSIQEAMRSIIYQALSSSPPTTITFAWAPAYDYELTVWQTPDNARTKGGITILLKSPYDKTSAAPANQSAAR
jgi:hypothetical protein